MVYVIANGIIIGNYSFFRAGEKLHTRGCFFHLDAISVGAKASKIYITQKIDIKYRS